MKKKILACTTAIAIILTMIVGCGQTKAGQGTTTKPAKTKVTFAMSADLGTLNQMTSASSTDAYMFSNLYNTLVKREKDGSYIPELADSWTVSNDGLTYTFKLKKGVKFHNGEELKAKDVVYTFNTAKKSAYLAESTAPIKEAAAVDDYTVKIILNQPYAPFLLNVSGIFILNEKATKAAGANYGKDNAVGTGPYKFVKHVTGQNVVFARNDNYFKSKPPIKDVEYKIITDENSTFVALQSGDVDFAFRVPAVSIQSAKNNPSLALHEFKGTMLTYIQINVKKKPFDNVKVRQALNYAVDKDSVIQMAFEGAAEKATSIINEQSFGYSADIKGYEFSPEKAKLLLKDAGYPNGFKVTFKTMEGTLKKAAEVIQENLSKVGITATIQSAEKNAYIADLGSGNYEIGDLGITMTPDLDAWQMLFHSKGGFNISKYSNSKVDALFDEGKKLSDVNQRKTKYKELLQILNDDAVVVPICFPINTYVSNKKLKVGYIDYGGSFYVEDMSWTK